MKNQRNAHKVQKLGAGYPIRAILIAFASVLPWLLWLFYVPAVIPLVTEIRLIGEFDKLPYAGAVLSWLRPKGWELEFYIFIWAVIFTARVLARSPLLRVRLKNAKLMIGTIWKCFMTSYVIPWYAFLTRFCENRCKKGNEVLLRRLWRRFCTALLLFLWIPVFYLLIFYGLRFVSVLLLPVVETCVLLYQNPYEEIAPFSEVFSPVYALLLFLLKFWLGSTLILSGPFRLFRWMHGLGENHFLRRLIVIGKGASSRWAGSKTYSKVTTSSGGSNIYLGSTDILDVGPEYGESVYLDDNGHYLTFGCPGSGKSISSLWPTMATYENSMIMIDPKGEHARETYWHRNHPEFTKRHKRSGGKIRTRNTLFRWNDKNPQSVCFKLDPFNEEPSIPNSYYNPLGEIDINDDNVREKLSAISDGCVVPEGAKNKHFTENARIVIEGIIAHILSSYSVEHRHLSNIHDLLMEFDPDCGLADPQQLDEVLYSMRSNPAAGGICAMAADVLGEREGETFHSIMGTVRRSIKWMGDPAMRKHLSSRSDFSFSIFREKTPHTLYIVAPIGEKLKEQVRWLRVLTNLGIAVMKNHEPQRGETLVILDEFPRMGGALSAITEGVTTLRSAKIKLWALMQNIGQLRKDYGEQANDFIEASTVQVFGVEGAGGGTAEWVSKQLGHYYNGQDFERKDARALLTSQEVVEFLGKDKSNQIVFHQGIPFPMRLKRRSHVRVKNRDGGFKRHPQMRGCFEQAKNS